MGPRVLFGEFPWWSCGLMIWLVSVETSVVKDPALLQLWSRLQLQLGFSPSLA